MKSLVVLLSIALSSTVFASQVISLKAGETAIVLANEESKVKCESSEKICNLDSDTCLSLPVGTACYTMDRAGVCVQRKLRDDGQRVCVCK